MSASTLIAAAASAATARGRRHRPSSGPTNGSATGDGSGSGVTCAAASPHPDYPYCYKASYPPCMAAGDERLAEKLSLTWQPKGGPWVGSSSDCRMLCCYGE